MGKYSLTDKFLGAVGVLFGAVAIVWGVTKMKSGKTLPLWHIETDKAHFNELKTQERFWQLVALARAVNALRFVHVALLGHESEAETLKANRTRFNSFFFNCALLYEALLLVQRMSKHYRHYSGFENLRGILRDPIATELRESSLASLRNRLAFHFDESEIGAQMAKTDMPPRFVSGEGEANIDVYYHLADLCAVGAFAGFSLDEPDALGKLGRRIAGATDLAIRFINAAEEFIVEVLSAEGWKAQE